MLLYELDKLEFKGLIVYYVVGGGFQKSVVYKNCAPLKYFHMKIVPPPPLGDKNF